MMAKLITHQIDAKVAAILKDFTQDKDLISGLFNEFYKFSIDEGDYDEKRLIRFLFKKYLKFTTWDKPFEKVNWEIPFKYKGISASVAHQKFGFRIYISNKVDEAVAKKLFEEILQRIELCLSLIEPAIREIGILSLKNGEVIVENKFQEIEKEFKFFLREARRKQKRSNMPTTLTLSGNLGKINYKHYEQAAYLSDATYIAFFSLVEHLCLLGLAFTNSPQRYQLEKYSKLNWQDKFKEIIPINDPEFNACYNNLVNLAKYRRNPTAHGYLDKTHAIFHFYLPEAAHRIPMGLYDRELFYRLKSGENLKVLEDFLQLVKKSKLTKKIMWYINAGFDVFYESDSFKRYQEYMNLSDAGAKEYLEYEGRIADNNANMDW